MISQSVDLLCPARGAPEPVVTWQRDGAPFTFVTQPNLRVEDGGQRLSVTNAQLGDIGAYSCVASNPAGNATKEFLLNVLGKGWRSWRGWGGSGVS